MSPASSWPNDRPERRAHRIAFYQRYGVKLDPSLSNLSFAQQVALGEDCIKSKSRKVASFRGYVQGVARIKNVSSMAKTTRVGNIWLQQIEQHCSTAQAAAATEDVLMIQPKDSGQSYRVLHCANFFDVMADIHYQNHVDENGKTMPSTGTDQTTCVRSIMERLYVDINDVTTLMSTCPFCHPTSCTTAALAVGHGVTPHSMTAKAPTTTTTATIAASSIAPLANPVAQQDLGAATPLPPPPPPQLPRPNTTAMSVTEQRPVVTPTKKRSASDTLDNIDLMAQDFVEQVRAMVDGMKQKDGNALSSHDTLQMFPADELQVLVERLLVTQHEFGQAGKPTEVRLAYHYTQSEQMDSIRAHGLLNKAERASSSIAVVRDNGISFGDGIYVAANPCAYHGWYGTVGLLVACLPGQNEDVSHKLKASGLANSGTVGRHLVEEFLVVSNSRQCAPILQFDAGQVVPNMFAHPGNMVLSEYQAKLQTIVDNTINAPSKKLSTTRSVKPKPSTDNVPVGPPIPLTAAVSKTIPISPPQQCTPETLQYVAFSSFQSQTQYFMRKYGPPPATTWTCSICQEGHVSRQTCQLVECDHIFHRHCLIKELEHCTKCPSCQKAVGPPLGKMPSGKMTISRLPGSSCAGHDHAGTICIDYFIYGGIQKQYHPHPGVKHGGTKRRVYLPETVDGCNLLKRLQYAFMHGLTFTVGISLATGRDNAVTWASIPHKTSLTGGVPRFGFPDQNYIDECNKELDKLGVPNAADLLK